MKKLVREIVLSRTWQQAVDDAAGEPIPRTGSSRTPTAAGSMPSKSATRSWPSAAQLDLETGGPNIGGAGDIDANNFSAQNIEYGYVYADTRRSVYTPAFRNKRLELFEVFDFGDINQSIGQRNVSTVAPQALFLLNHPFVIEQARAAAERTLALDRAPTRSGSPPPSAAPSAARRPPRSGRNAARFLSEVRPAREAWAQLHQTLFACVDFRYLELSRLSPQRH